MGAGGKNSIGELLDSEFETNFITLGMDVFCTGDYPRVIELDGIVPIRKYEMAIRQI